MTNCFKDLNAFLYKFSLCLLNTFLCFAGQASPGDIKYLSIEQGLSNNSVRCIYQDHKGFMWFGTYNGLNRYDGYAFSIFRNKLDDSTSLPHNYIYAIGEDQHNNLWVGTGQGAIIYNSLNASFSPVYYYSSETGAKQKLTTNTTLIKADAQNNVFIGTNGRGLLIQFNGANTATQIPYESGKNKLTGYHVTSILIVKQQVWLFINDIGLCRYDYSTKKIMLVSNAIKNASAIAGDGRVIWLGSNTGLYLFNTSSGKITKTFTEAAGKLTSNTIATLYLDHKQNLWIGTEGGGVNILNTITEKLEYLQPSQEGQSLSSESAVAIFEDKESRKWIGTLKGGIDIIDPEKKQFQSYTHNPANANSLIYNFTSCFFEDTSKNLWIGTDGGGLSIWNRQQNHFANYSHQSGDARSLSNNRISSIRQDYKGDYWVATFGSGVNKFNKQTGTFQQYHCINPLTGLENENVWLLYEDRLKTLWATTFSQGQLYRYNRIADKFEMYAPDVFDLISFTEDAGGTLWAGNSHQLIKINRTNGSNQFYEIGKPVRAVYEDKQKNLWLGTEGGGLVLFNRHSGKISNRFSESDDLCNNSVLNILEDSKGNLWLSTFNGLSEFTPASKLFKNFNQSDGLQSNQFSYSAALRLQSGELVFGGIKGFTMFDPDGLQSHKSMPPVMLTGLRINNKPVTGNDAYIVKTTLSAIEELKIPYDEGALAIDFAALEYSSPDKIYYACYLEGWDKDWNYTGNVRTASYTHLREGTYHLRIKATNANGEWNKKEATLQITVLPPWYRTWWAYLIYVLTAVSLVYIYLRYKTWQTRLEYEVKLAHLETEKEKELNEKKLSFFTDMSHEFRTPLTLIINPVKDMLLDDEKIKDKNNLNIVYRNARRLLSLVDQLILFRKADTEGNRLKVSRLNYTTLCRDVYLCFVQEARSRKIDYVFDCPEDIQLYADRQKVEIAIYNLLSNAIKYTPANGSIRFEVKETDTEIITTVSDSGPGIPQDAGNRIFDRFYQAIDQHSISKPGFGIGLSLVKSVAENHHGSIRYHSEPGHGATFILALLKGKTHFAREFVCDDEVPATPLIQGEIISAAAESKETEKLDELVSISATLLIVEDNEQLRQYIAGIFLGKYKILEANSGEEGLQIAKNELPDLIISDNIMGEMTGMQLCNIIKKDSALGHIPVIILTGSLSPEGRLKGIEHGADDYITKPFEKDLLVARVTNLLQNRSTLQKYFYNEITLQKNNLKVSAEYKVFLEKCIAIVEAHLDDEQFSIKTLEREIGMSHSGIYKRVKSISGQSVNSFIRFIRLRKAAELFINTNQNVNETAFQVGINDVKYFREQFNKLFGMNPSEYIKKYRKAFSHSYRINKEVFGKDALGGDVPA